MKLTVRRADERGHADHGWLESYHTFSFASYHDPRHLGFRSLRVINQDRVAPGGGFPTHPHQEMEIFSYVLEGVLAHQDSLGNRRELLPGQIQLMSAGRGVTHSEFNPSASQPLHFLQIWIQPGTRGLPPAYTEWQPQPGTEADAQVLVISGDGRAGSATLRQDADIYRVRLGAGGTLTYPIRPGRGVWFQMITGAIMAQGVNLAAGDAGSTEDSGSLVLTAGEPAEALLFDLG